MRTLDACLARRTAWSFSLVSPGLRARSSPRPRSTGASTSSGERSPHPIVSAIELEARDDGFGALQERRLLAGTDGHRLGGAGRDPNLAARDLDRSAIVGRGEGQLGPDHLDVAAGEAEVRRRAVEMGNIGDERPVLQRGRAPLFGAELDLGRAIERDLGAVLEGEMRARLGVGLERGARLDRGAADDRRASALGVTGLDPARLVGGRA